MKTFTILSAALLFLLVPLVFASPFLSSDPNPTHTSYQVRLSADNGVTWGAWVEGPPKDNHLWFDLGTTAPGPYKGEAQGFGTWEVTDGMTGTKSSEQTWSPSAPFLLKVPSGVTGIKGEK